MLKNFSNGIFAFGIFFGYCLSLVSIFLLFSEFKIEDQVVNTLIGVVVGGIITLLVTAWVRISEKQDAAESLARILKIRIRDNLLCLDLMEKSFAQARKASTEFAEKDSEYMFLINFNIFPVDRYLVRPEQFSHTASGMI